MNSVIAMVRSSSEQQAALSQTHSSTAHREMAHAHQVGDERVPFCKDVTQRHILSA